MIRRFLMIAPFFILITMTYSCLEPTGDEGSAIGKNTGDEDTEGDSEDSTDQGDNDQTPGTAETFALLQPVITEGCLNGCHDGVIDPNLSTAAGWTAASTDNPDQTIGDDAVATMDGTGNPMPPVGASHTLPEADKTRLLEWIDAGMP